MPGPFPFLLLRPTCPNRRACDQAAAPAWEAAPVGAPAALDEPVRPAAGGGVPAGARALAVAGAAHAAPRPSQAAAAAVVRLPWAAYARVVEEASSLVVVPRAPAVYAPAEAVPPSWAVCAPAGAALPGSAASVPAAAALPASAVSAPVAPAAPPGSAVSVPVVAALPSVSAQAWARLCLYPDRSSARGRLPASPAWLCFEPAMAAA